MNVDPSLYDEFFCGVLSSEGDISSFLNAVIGFLFRRTDFFVVMKNKGALGFSPGEAEKILLNIFHKWQLKALEVYENKESRDENDSLTVHNNFLKQGASKNSEGGNETDDINLSSSGLTTQENELEKSGPISHGLRKTSEISDITRYDSEIYNGASRDHYWWSQSITDADVCICVPPHVKKGNQVKVLINQLELIIKVKSNSSLDTWTSIIEEKLSNLCNKEDIIWSLDTNRSILQLHLEKSYEKWWDQLFVSEPKIDLRNIEATRSFHGLSEEEQMHVAELMHKDRLKQEARAHNGPMREPLV